MLKRKHFLFMLFCIASSSVVPAQNQALMKVNLDDLFELADKKNRTLKIQDFNEKISSELVSDEEKKLLPSLDASLSFSFLGNGWIADRNFSNAVKAPIPNFGNNFALEATQVLYAGKAIQTAIEMAKQNHALTQLDKEKSRQDIRLLIAGYYLELLKLNNQQVILERNMLQTKKLIEQINAKFRLGTSLKNNTTRYELQRQSLELALLNLENSRAIVNKELVKILQLPVGTRLKPDATLINNSQLLEDQSWQNIALQKSPLLKQLPILAGISRHRETMAKPEKLPQIVAFAGDKLDGPITIEIPPINKNFNYWYAGVGIRYNIASNYKKNTKISQARLSAQRTLEQHEQVREQLFTEIEAAQLRYLETFSVYQIQLKAVQLASENYTIIQNRYLNNLALVTEMLDAENAMISAEMRAANAQINILFHHFQLKKLTGTL